MDPLRTMPLRELRRVLRRAERLYQRDRAREEEARLREEYLRAAAEVGLTEEYLHRAARDLRQGRERRLRTALGVAAAGAMTSLVALSTLTMLMAFQPVQTAATVVEEYHGPRFETPPPPPLAEPMDATVILTPNPPIALEWREYRHGFEREREFRWRPRHRDYHPGWEVTEPDPATLPVPPPGSIPY